jgi:hypothetical protein
MSFEEALKKLMIRHGISVEKLFELIECGVGINVEKLNFYEDDYRKLNGFYYELSTWVYGPREYKED